jgi:hypothetical protein
MKDTRLADLNFKDLLQYGGQPEVKNSYNPPLQCSGYCVTCDEKNPRIQLDLMSHGCDSRDFRSLLGPLPTTSEFVDEPILFLLERPGGDWANGAGRGITFRGFNKKPPVGHYYWTSARSGLKTGVM